MSRIGRALPLGAHVVPRWAARATVLRPMRILILGAGFAGVQAAGELDRQLRHRRDCEILLVDEHNYFLFTPLLPQNVSSYTNPRHIVQPVRDLRGRLCASENEPAPPAASPAS